MSRPDQCVVTVRFFVGENREDSLRSNHGWSNRSRLMMSPSWWPFCGAIIPG
jgi:hypothetical protein